MLPAGFAAGSCATEATPSRRVSTSLPRPCVWSRTTTTTSPRRPPFRPLPPPTPTPCGRWCGAWRRTSAIPPAGSTTPATRASRWSIPDRCWPIQGQFGPNSVQHRSSFGHVWPRSGKFRRFMASAGVQILRHRAKFGRFRAPVGRRQPIDDAGPTLADAGPSLVHAGSIWSMFARVWPQISRNRPELGRCQAKVADVGRLRPQIWAKIKRHNSIAYRAPATM